MPARPPDPTAEELAAALRDGLASRRFFRILPTADFPPPAGLELFPRLVYYRRVLDHPVPHTRLPVLGWLVRAARRVVKKLIDPWLLHQTEFNLAAAAHADIVQRALVELTVRLNTIQKDIVPAYQTANARVAECVYDIHRLWAEVRPGEEPPSALLDPGDGPPADPPHVIEGLFLHTRIGPPPGRVLVAGLGGMHALDLASLGFQVVLHTAAYDPPSHPGLRAVPAGSPGRLPYDDDTFDRVIVTVRPGDTWAEPGSPVWAEFARVLAPGGKLLGSRTGEVGEPATGPLRPTEVAYARRAGHGWALSDEPADDAEVVLWVAEKA